MEKKNLKGLIAEAVNMPKDVLLGVPIITLTGHSEVCIENYRGILEYTEQLIRVQTKIGKIHIIGKRLEIVYYTNDEMKITGQITTVEYYEGG